MIVNTGEDSMSDIALGLDVGTTSIGWALVDKDAEYIIDSGVRIFSNGRDPKTGASLAVDRRDKRGQRRRRDRYLKRRKRLSRFLVQYGFLPAHGTPENKKLFAQDPYELRFRALEEQLSPYEVGRAIFHLNQRRGFKSNRKTDRSGDDKDAGVIYEGGVALREKMEATGSRTLGEYLYKLPYHQAKRARTNHENKYPFYPQRQNIEDEFEKIWETQKAFAPAQYPQQAYEDIKDTLLHQRPLRPVKPGKCLYCNDEDRLAKAHPLFQQCRLYQEVNALRITQAGADSRPLTIEERDKLIQTLTPKKEVTFKKLGQVLKLSSDQSFNKESDVRKKLLGDEVCNLMSKKDYFGKVWQTWDWERQAEIISWLQDAKIDDADLKAKLLHLDPSLDDERLNKILNASLPEGYGSLGETATKKILDKLKAHVIVYSQAVEECGWNHSDFNTGEILSRLPYYGEILFKEIGTGSGQKNDPEEIRFGKIPNPTVHIGLRQVGKLVNAVIDRYGKPDHMAVELAREFPMGQKTKSEYESRLKKNTQEAQRRGEELEKVFHQTNNGRNRARLKLWEEEKRDNGGQHFCPYCGDTIGTSQLFTNQVEEDHILPFSRTLDNSLANRVVVHKRCNQIKGNRTPYEAFGDDERWKSISDNALSLPRNKRWRFTPSAMEHFDDVGGFIARQLTDTQYLSKMVGKYLRALYPDPKQFHEAVILTPGGMTAFLRRVWGLDSLLWELNPSQESDEEESKASLLKKKNRNDHRHHAIDATVIAVTDRSTLKNVITAAKHAEARDPQKLICDMPLPWERFRHDLKDELKEMVVSFKQDHGLDKHISKRHDETSGPLLDETSWGAVDKEAFQEHARKYPGQPINLEVVTRISRTDITLKHLTDAKGAYIADSGLRRTLIKLSEGKNESEFQKALAEFFSSKEKSGCWYGLRHVRIHRDRSIIPIMSSSRKEQFPLAYKGYVAYSKSYLELWEVTEKHKKKWVSVVVPTFQENQGHRMSTRPLPNAKFIMRLFKNDMLAIEDGRRRRTMYVAKLNQSGSVFLADHNEANAAERDTDKKVNFNYLQLRSSSLRKKLARKLRVDMLGKVYDPGFKVD